jgi:DNA mismatch repair protein MutS
MHSVKPGPASKSYGLAVAKLAGIPRDVLVEARRYLNALETQARDTNGPQGRLELDSPEVSAPEPHPSDELSSLRAALQGLHPDAMTPRDALQKLYELKKLLTR